MCCSDVSVYELPPRDEKAAGGGRVSGHRWRGEERSGGAAAVVCGACVAGH